MRTFTRHALFWLIIYIAWTYMKSTGVHYSKYLVINLLNVAIYMTAYYSLKHILIPKFFDRGKFVLFTIGLLVSTFVFYTIWRTTGILWIDELRGINYSKKYMSAVGYLTQTVQFYSPAMVLLAWESHLERKKEQARIQQLEKEKLSTELKFLKAQLNPHFLFNTLNNLYSYVVTNSPKAPDMILRLSGILDYVLYKSQNQSVPLKEEVNAIENFIALEKIRYGDRLHIDFNQVGNSSVPVSPLLLLSIVENAFKHGASGDIDTPKITIDIAAEYAFIKCTVWNTKSKYQGEINDDYKEGIGLSNIKRQLNLVYPDQHRLNIDDQEQTFSIDLKINLVNE